MNNQDIYTGIALCAVGAEKVVSNELKKLNLKVEESSYGKVRFKTNVSAIKTADTLPIDGISPVSATSSISGLYKALIGLRAADRVLLEIANFKAQDFDALFEGAYSAEWERIIPKGMGLVVVKVRTNRSQLKAETSIQAIVHKAAAQKLCQKHKINRLPEPKQIVKGSGEEAVKTAEVRVYIEKDTVSLLIDLSGEPLFKRGYRSEGGTAPLRETTAAALLLLTGWKRKLPLYDPFCGSGTFLIEALSYAYDMAPGLGRRFAIEDLLIADAKTEKAVREEYLSKIDFTRRIRIAGSDEEARSVSIAASNAARLRDIAEGRPPQRGIRTTRDMKPDIDIKVLKMNEAHPPNYYVQADIIRPSFAHDENKKSSEKKPSTSSLLPSTSSSGLLITNPPYGKRLGDPLLAEQTYRDMASLAERFPGWKLAVITDHSGFESFYGKKADSCREISNGNTPSFFFQYELL